MSDRDQMPCGELVGKTTTVTELFCGLPEGHGGHHQVTEPEPATQEPDGFIIDVEGMDLFVRTSEAAAQTEAMHLGGRICGFRYIHGPPTGEEG